MRRRQVGIGILVGLTLACGAELPPLDASEPLVERSGDDLRIRWSQAPEGRVQVYASTTPDRFERGEPVAQLEAGAATISGLAAAQRHYFELVPDAGPSRVVAERQLPLEGADNFRDLGGYRTADGRAVRWGLLYRSNHLGDLTDADVDYISGLDIRLVCDFRSPKERELHPDRLPETDPPTVINPAIYDPSLDPSEIEAAIRSGNFGDRDFGTLLVDANRAFATRFRDRYAAMFERIAQPENLPALVHCTAGKDRAGFGSALLLLALGVPEETVFRDFLLTNHFTADRIERTLLVIRFVSLFRTDPESVRPLLGVRPEYLQAGLDAIREKYGSFDTYLRDGLGVDDAKRATLQAALLQ